MTELKCMKRSDLLLNTTKVDTEHSKQLLNKVADFLESSKNEPAANNIEDVTECDNVIELELLIPRDKEDGDTTEESDSSESEEDEDETRPKPLIQELNKDK